MPATIIGSAVSVSHSPRTVSAGSRPAAATHLKAGSKLKSSPRRFRTSLSDAFTRVALLIKACPTFNIQR